MIIGTVSGAGGTCNGCSLWFTYNNLEMSSLVAPSVTSKIMIARLNTAKFSGMLVFIFIFIFQFYCITGHSHTPCGAWDSSPYISALLTSFHLRRRCMYQYQVNAVPPHDICKYSYWFRRPVFSCLLACLGDTHVSVWKKTEPEGGEKYEK